MAQNLAGCPDLKAGQDVVLPVESPIKSTGHLQILYGNLCPDGSVAKITGKEGLQFTGQVRRRQQQRVQGTSLKNYAACFKVWGL
jgi:dihydroxy-acid dehydratase